MFDLPPRLPALFCVVLVLFALPLLTMGKQADPAGSAPPEPQELHLKVHREGKTEIPLKIYSKASEPLKYMIRVPPEHGKLSEPRVTDRETSVVIYEPPADLSITTDKFFYTVQSTMGVSGAVPIYITIVDQPPKLAFPDSLDFGKVRVGASAFRLLEVTNKGGLPANGEIVVDPPWRVEGKPGYHLAPSDVAVFKIFFEPTAARSYEGIAHFSSERETSVALQGIAEASMVIDPAEWNLQQIPGGLTRTGSFEISSQLDVPRTLQIKGDPRLKLPAEISLPAHGKAMVNVEATADAPHAWQAEVHITGTDFSATIPVRAPALGAVLQAITKSLDFGRLTSEHNGKIQFQLENAGGSPGGISWNIDAPFHTPVASAVLQPGEKKSFELEIDTKKPGHYRTWLQFSGNAQNFDLPVQAEVAGVAGASASEAATNPGGTASPETGAPGSHPSGVPSPTDLPPGPDLPWATDVQLPKGVSVHHITGTSAIVEWPATLSKSNQFIVEMIQFQVGKGNLMQANWLQPTGIPIQAQGANYKATLKGLTPNQPWLIRVRAINDGTDAGTRLFTVQFWTPPGSSILDWFPQITFFRVLLAALAVLLGWQGWQWWRYRYTPRT